MFAAFSNAARHPSGEGFTHILPREDTLKSLQLFFSLSCGADCYLRPREDRIGARAKAERVFLRRSSMQYFTDKG